MKKTGFTLTNKYGSVIGLSLEPEGTIYELKPNESVGVEISTGENPAIEIVFEKNPTGVYIALWGDKGDYHTDIDNV